MRAITQLFRAVHRGPVPFLFGRRSHDLISDSLQEIREYDRQCSTEQGLSALGGVVAQRQPKLRRLINPRPYLRKRATEPKPTPDIDQGWYQMGVLIL